MFAGMANRLPGAQEVQLRKAAAPPMFPPCRSSPTSRWGGVVPSVASSNSLSIEDIARYQCAVESVCLNRQDDALVRDVRKRTDYVIDVRH
jgi:hypothetical protein